MMSFSLIQSRMKIFLCRLFLSLADSVIEKYPRWKKIVEIKTFENYYMQIQNKCEDFVLHIVDLRSVEKILNDLNVAKFFTIDQISAKFLKDGAPRLAIHIANLINFSTKLYTFPLQCKIANI